MKENIYEPAEDSFMLAEFVKEYAKQASKILDMGTGSGIQAETARKANKKVEIDAVDINEDAVNALSKNKNKINVFVSDLFSNVKGKYDLIIFNAPYLPDDAEKEFNSPNWSGGKQGIEITLEFFKQSTNHLLKGGIILFTYSSLSNTNLMIKEITKQGLDLKNLTSKEFFYENLFVAEAKLK